MDRLNISFFGLCNAGKSSLVNAFTSQQLSIVSPERGTTTDPVQKTMELLPLGPVMIIDTPGIDDDTALGALRTERAKRIIARTDIAILAKEAGTELSEREEELIRALKQRSVPLITAYTKSDLLPAVPPSGEDFIYVSAKEGVNIKELREMAGRLGKRAERPLVEDLVSEGDIVILVCPIDASAPKGRLILPQQMVARSILDAGAAALTVQPRQLGIALSALSAQPALVITDSQAFAEAAAIAQGLPLTSFSILMARYKGELEEQLEGVEGIRRLSDGDRVLIAEGCTHHRQCEDIGTVKIPALLRSRTGKQLSFEFASGHDFPSDLSAYSLIIHCGACMLGESEVRSRVEEARRQGKAITNYGMTLAYLNGILDRALEPLGGFPGKG